MTTEYGTAPPPAPAPGRTNVLAIVSLVAGLISLPLFCCWPVSIPLGLVAIVLGFVAKGQIKRTGESGNGLAIAGIVTGALAIVLFVLLVVVFGVVDQNALQQRFQQQQQGLEDEVLMEEQEIDDLGEPADDGVDRTENGLDAEPEPAGDTGPDLPNPDL